jgi:hypothetical protein
MAPNHSSHITDTHSLLGAATFTGVRGKKDSNSCKYTTRRQSPSGSTATLSGVSNCSTLRALHPRCQLCLSHDDRYSAKTLSEEATISHLSWLRRADGDRLLVRLPSIGKTFLLRKPERCAEPCLHQ